jgi:parallel beta-helix repeat protein
MTKTNQKGREGVRKMTSTKTTTKTNHYCRMLMALAALLAAMVLAAGSPALAVSNTFTVNFNGDLSDVNPGDGICDVSAATSVDCTLRAAIEEANRTTDADTINFDISEAFRDPNTGVATISPTSALPAITQQLTIDGYSQRGASLNTKTVGNDAALKVQLTGRNLSIARGLEIDGADSSVIRGLAINGFVRGIDIRGDSVGNRIEGDFIGTDATGTQLLGNSLEGVIISSGPSQTVVGGATPDKRNVISGNGFDGISISSSNGSLIKGNYIGTDKSGTIDFGNQFGGVAIGGASGTTVGGTTAASRNLISGNNINGVDVNFSQGTKVLGNRIGTTASGAATLGNLAAGVFISGTASGTLVGNGTSAGSNTVAFNGHDGIHIQDNSTANEVSRNSIFSNGGLGIDLVGQSETTVTDVSNANDTGDTDTGPNNLQNKPVLSSAKTVSGKTTIKGNLKTLPILDEPYKVQFFSNPSGNEGKMFLGEKAIRTDKSGLATFTFSPATKVAVGQTITATATRTSTHDTSEFSSARTVASS